MAARANGGTSRGDRPSAAATRWFASVSGTRSRPTSAFDRREGQIIVRRGKLRRILQDLRGDRLRQRLADQPSTVTLLDRSAFREVTKAVLVGRSQTSFIQAAARRFDAAPGASWVLFGLWAVCTAFNLTKAVHIDDAAYLLTAQAILRDPLHPMSALISWDAVPGPIHYLAPPHLFMFQLAAVLRVASSEVAVHLLFAVCTGLTIWFFHGLCRTLAPRRALLLAALLALGPPFLPGPNLMPGGPVLALWMG